jgi:DNA polymerase elongation subunit (family B)
MMKFYTNVSRFGNNILYVGYANGHRIKESVKFNPTLFLATNQPSKYKTLDGTNVDSVEPGTMRDCKEFIETHSASNFTVYGNTDYVAQYINSRFPNTCTFDRDALNVSFIDIEVQSDQGFPHPKDAAFPVTAITLKNNIDHIYYTWGIGEYDASKCMIQDAKVNYTQCKDEYTLLNKFIAQWQMNHPDVISGWNSEGFDIPYLVNRISRLFGDEELKRLSIHHMMPNAKTDRFSGEVSFTIPGMAHLDYMRLFKKFMYIPMESYSLNHVSSVILGEKKIDYSEFTSLNELYSKDHQKFIDYNIKDVQLVERLDDKLGLVSLCMTLAHKANVNYEVAFGSTKIWDTFIYNILQKQNIVLSPQKPVLNDRRIEGAYVKEPIKGMNHWVCSFDLNSLYPHIIMQWNMSPETVADGVYPGVNVDSLLSGAKFDIPEDTCVAATGQLFSTKKKGIFPAIIDKLYAERSDIKKNMLDAKQELENLDKTDKLKKFELEKIISQCDNQQMAIKILMNSLYGALSNTYFRYYDIRIAEAITISGQYAVRWAANNVNAYLQNILKTKKDYVIASDTDSIYVNLGDLVEKSIQGDDEKICAFVDKVAAQKIEPLLDSCYDKLKDTVGAREQRMVMKREIIASKMIITGKKRYIANVLNSEGVQYAKPKMKITGIESVRSSTPQICRTLIEKTLDVIINEDQDAVQKFIADARVAFRKLRPEEVAFPRGVSDIEKYTDKTGPDGYTKGTPIHVRASILYNQTIINNKLGKKYPLIRSGDKIKFSYLKVPNRIKENVIAFPDVLPMELNLENYIDYNKQFNKSYLEPMKHILEAIGWSTEKTNTIEDFFL